MLQLITRNAIIASMILMVAQPPRAVACPARAFLGTPEAQTAIERQVLETRAEYGRVSRAIMRGLHPFIKRSIRKNCVTASACTVDDVRAVSRDIVLRWGSNTDSTKSFLVLTLIMIASTIVSSKISASIPEEASFFKQFLVLLNAFGFTAIVYRYSFPMQEKIRKWSHRTEKSNLSDPYDRNQTLEDLRLRSEEVTGNLQAWGRSIIRDSIMFLGPRFVVAINAAETGNWDRVAGQMAHMFVSIRHKYPEISPHNKFLASEFWGLLDMPASVRDDLPAKILSHIREQEVALTGDPPSQDVETYYYKPIIDLWLSEQGPTEP